MYDTVQLQVFVVENFRNYTVTTKHYLQKFSILGTRWALRQIHKLLRYFKPQSFPTAIIPYSVLGCDFTKALAIYSKGYSLSIMHQYIIILTRVATCDACMLQTFSDVAPSCRACDLALHFTLLAIAVIRSCGTYVILILTNCYWITNLFLWTHWKSDHFTKILYYENLELMVLIIVV